MDDVATVSIHAQVFGLRSAVDDGYRDRVTRRDGGTTLVRELVVVGDEHDGVIELLKRSEQRGVLGAFELELVDGRDVDKASGFELSPQPLRQVLVEDDLRPQAIAFRTSAS
jgi:hypothetical protein